MNTEKSTTVETAEAKPDCAPTGLLGIALQTLNEAYAADSNAMHALICNRVPCNKNLADHPTIQVNVNKVTPEESFAVGMIGVINGIIERATGKRVAAKFSEPDSEGQRQLIGFCEYKPKDA